jgi:transcriptional regulator with XRE-family HTH domain
VKRKQLDVAALYQALDYIRSFGEMTWRDVARQTGCSPSTFSRLAEGKRPDADALCALIAWLRVPLARFTVNAEQGPHPTCIDVTAIDQPPRSAWICGPDCPKEA